MAVIVAGYVAGKRADAIAADIGYATGTVKQTAVRLRVAGVVVPKSSDGAGIVPVLPFRERFLDLQRRGVSLSEVARRLDWKDRGVDDAGRVSRTLGLRPYGTRGHSYVRERLTPTMARALCDALGLAPYEVGL